MSLYVGYEPASTCTGSATPGAKALMSWFIGAYGNQGGVNLGIYVCKTIVGTATTSLHGEGRACDLGHRPYQLPPWGQHLADALVGYSRELGIQCVIFNRRIWSGSYPYAGWRTYTGAEPHTGHIHTELSRASARTLTTTRVQQILGGAPVPPPTPRDWTEVLIMALPTLRKGTRGEDVQSLQGLLIARGHAVGRAGMDGIWGPATDTAVRAFQRARKIAVDGVVGKITWHHLHNQQRLL